MGSAHSLDGLTKWLERREWREPFEEVLGWHLGPACGEADIDVEELPSLIGPERSTVLWGCIFEDMLATETEDGRNIVDDYVKRRGWKETVPNRKYMLALRSSVMSLYEISDIVPEQSFLARDLIRGGEPVRVSEKAGTRSLKPWDRIAARIVEVGSKTQMAGGVLPFDHVASEEVIESVRKAVRKARAEATVKARESGMPLDKRVRTAIAETFSETEILRASAFIFTNAWLGAVLRQILNPALPALINTDGEAIVFISAHYRFAPTATADSIAQALAGVPSLRAEGDGFWNWIGPQNRHDRKPQNDARMLVTTLDDGSLVLGTIELKEKTLTLAVNSEDRLRRGRAFLDLVLAGLVGEPLIERQTLEQLVASAPKDAAAPSSGLSAEEERVLIHDMLTEHYRRTLDEPVPALGGVTPRKAVKTKAGKQKVAAWLKLMENSGAHHPAGEPMAEYDYAWLWQELGIADRRR